MKINSIPTIRFSSIYAISAKRDVMEGISEKCDNYPSDSLKFMSATDLYKNNSDGDGFCHSAVNKDNKEVAFLVVGSEDCGNVRFMENGYTALGGISQHLEEGYEVDDIESGKKLIDDLIAKEKKQPPCHQDCANCFYTENAD